MRLKLIRPGTEIKLLNGLPGIVMQVNIMGAEAALQYQVAYWSEGSRRLEWLFPVEIDQHPDDAGLGVEL